MTLPTFVTAIPGSTRQFLENIFQKKTSSSRAQQSQAQYSPSDTKSPPPPPITSPSYHSLLPSPSLYSNNDTLDYSSSSSLVAPSFGSSVYNKSNNSGNNVSISSSTNSSHRHVGSPLKECNAPHPPILLPPRRSSIVTTNSSSVPADATVPTTPYTPTKLGTTPHGQSFTITSIPVTFVTRRGKNNSELGPAEDVVALDHQEPISPTSPLSPSSMRRRFEYLTLHRETVTSVSSANADGSVGGGGNGGSSGSGKTGHLLSSLAATFKKQSNSDMQKQEQEQHSQQPLQITLKSPRSQQSLVTERRKDPVGQSMLATAAVIKRTSSPSLSSSFTVTEMPTLQSTRPKPTHTTATTLSTSMASPYLHPFSTTASTASLANTTSSATTIINNRRPFNTPSSTVAHSHLQTPSNPQVPSSSSILTKWPELPKTVMICELSEYIPNDSFGRNAKRNENYARARLVALREHQQILVGFLSDLLALEQYQRMEEQVLVAAMDSARQGNSARATAAPMAFSPIERAAGVPKKAKADPRLEPTAALMIGESECTCNCERRHRLLLEKRHAAIRAYQRAILDLWQTDQNMCYWLSRYIRTIRHIGRGLDYMIAAILEGNRSNSCDTKPSAPLCSFRCPPNLGVLEGVGNTSFTREALFNTCSLSGVSNPELERMGILQTKLINYNAGMSYNKGGAGIGGGNGNGGHSSQVLANVVAPPSRTHPDSSTLGNIDSQPSLASQHGYMLEISRALPRPFFSQSVDQHTIPAIRINSPELLFKPLPKVLDGANAAPVSTSAFPNTSYRTPFAPSSGDKAMTSTSDVATAGTTTTASFTDAALTPVNTISNNNNNSNSVSITVPGRIFPTFSGPLSNESIRELVTLSAPVVPPPAVPAPNRPRPPTYPLLLPFSPSLRARSTVKIASTAFFPSVPSPPDLTLNSSSWNHPASTIASAAILSAALTAAKDTESNDTELLSSLSPSLLLPPILELNPLHNSHDVHPFDYVPVSGTSSNHSEHSVPRHIETVDHSTSQSGTRFPEIVTTSASATSTTTTTKTATAPNNSTPSQRLREYPGDDDTNEIDASVFLGYHLQSLAKANELLLQFNKESHRSFGVLQRYEAARQAFERRVLGLSADCGSDVS